MAFSNNSYGSPCHNTRSYKDDARSYMEDTMQHTALLCGQYNSGNTDENHYTLNATLGSGSYFEHTCRSNSITVLQGNLFCIIIQELWRSKKKFRVYCCVFFCVVLFRSRFTIALRGTALGLNANSFKYIVTTQDNFSTQYFTCTRASSPSCEHERVGAVPRKPVSVTSSTVSPIESTRVAFTKDTTMYASKSSERKQPTYNTTKKHTVSACYGNDIKLMI